MAWHRRVMSRWPFRTAALTVALAAVCVQSGFAGDKRRTWKDLSGSYTLDGVFEKLEDEVVHLRVAGGKLAKIPIAKLSPEDQAYARDMHSGTDATDDPFVIESDTSSPGADPRQPEATADAAVRVVVAEGVGVDVESAKKDAYRQAVRQVVGAFVDAATLVKNDALLEDRVLTLSSGFVEKADPMSESREGGLVRIRVRAHVRLTKLLDTLNANRIATIRVDGESLAAQMVTKVDQQQGSEAILRKHLSRFHEECLTVTVAGQPAAGRAAGDAVDANVRIAISPNRQAFMAVSQKVVAVLDATPRKHGEIVSDGRKPSNGKNYDDLVKDLSDDILVDHNWGDLIEIFADRTERERTVASGDRDGNSPLIEYKPIYLVSDPTCTGDGALGVDGLRFTTWDKLYGRDGSGILVLLVRTNDTYQRTHWRWFHLTKDEMELVRKSLPNVVRCTTRLIGSDGEEIARDVLRLGQLGIAADTTWPIIAIAPFFVQEDLRYYVPSFTLTRTLALQKSEISTVSRAEVSLAEEPSDP